MEYLFNKLYDLPYNIVTRTHNKTYRQTLQHITACWGFISPTSGSVVYLWIKKLNIGDMDISNISTVKFWSHDRIMSFLWQGNWLIVLCDRSPARCLANYPPPFQTIHLVPVALFSVSLLSFSRFSPSVITIIYFLPTVLSVTLGQTEAQLLSWLMQVSLSLPETANFLDLRYNQINYPFFLLRRQTSQLSQAWHFAIL